MGSAVMVKLVTARAFWTLWKCFLGSNICFFVNVLLGKRKIIIFYNAFILSKLLEHKEAIDRHEEANMIKRVSPVHGDILIFTFRQRGCSFNVAEIVGSLLERVRFQLTEDE